MWLGEIVSPGAVGLRVQFTQMALPKSTELAVTLPSAGGDWAEKVEWVEADARQKGESIAPLIPGERVRIEYFAPIGTFNPTVYSLPFVVSGVQHFYRDPLTGEVASAAGSCHNDVTCYPAWASVPPKRWRASPSFRAAQFPPARGSDQRAEFRPHALLADRQPLHVDPGGGLDHPVLLALPDLDLRGTPPSLGSVPTSTGATLMATGASSDYTLLILVEGGLPSRFDVV